MGRKSMLTQGEAMRTRGHRDYQAHGVDMSTPSQIAKPVWGSVTVGELNTVSKNTQLSKYDWKTRKGDKGKEYKVIGSSRKTPGVSYESDWRSSREGAYRDASFMNRYAKAKQE